MNTNCQTALLLGGLSTALVALSIPLCKLDEYKKGTWLENRVKIFEGDGEWCGIVNNIVDYTYDSIGTLMGDQADL